MSEQISRAVVARLYPNRVQAASLRRWQGGLRRIWNESLAWCFAQRADAGKWPGKAAIQAYMVSLKRREETRWMAEIPAHAILALAEDQRRALKNWFEKRAKRPKFRGKRHRQFSVYMVNQQTGFGEAKVSLPKLGEVRFRAGDLPAGRLLGARAYREADKWYLSAVFECDPPDYVSPAVERAGVDMGLKTMATVYDGAQIVEIRSPKALREHEMRLKRYQRQYARRVPGSKRREEAKRRVAREHQRVANIRKDCAHKATSWLVRHAQEIVVESLNVAGMMRNRHLAKSVADTGMGEFLRQVRYKGQWQRRDVIEADRWYPSTKLCSKCDSHNPDVVLGVDAWTCPACGTRHQRDENAARNLYAYPEERGNAGGLPPKTRGETGDQDRAATPAPAPVIEPRISKRASQNHRVAQSK